MIAEAQHILATTKLPEDRSQRACELPTAAGSLTDDLLEQSPAAVLGKNVGRVMAKRGPEYFRRIAAVAERTQGRTAI